jgi:hypothetical protein
MLIIHYSAATAPTSKLVRDCLSPPLDPPKHYRIPLKALKAAKAKYIFLLDIDKVSNVLGQSL